MNDGSFIQFYLIPVVFSQEIRIISLFPYLTYCMDLELICLVRIHKHLFV